MIAVVTDSTTDIPPQLARELNIQVVPLSVNFGSETYRDAIDMTADQFYRRLVESSVSPTTSQPPVGAFHDVYTKLAEQGVDGIISIHLASAFSGTYQSAEQARELMENKLPITLIDTGSVSMGAGWLAVVAARAAKEGAAIEKVEALVRERLPRAMVIAAFDTLKYLERGGRIGRSRALLGTLLSVKPIVDIGEGEIRPYEQVRTMKRAVGRLVELAKEHGPWEELSVLYSTGEENARAVADQLGNVHPRDKIVVGQLGAVVGTHAGPGLVGFTGIRK